MEGRPAPRSADGLRVLADMRYRPPGLARDAGAHRLDACVPTSGTGPWPLVVYAHGGGLNAGDKDDETRVNRNLAIAIAQRGFVVLNINHRLVDEAPHPAQAEDMAAALRWGIDHAAELMADPEQLVLAGFSSGGYLAALLAGQPRYLGAQQIDRRRLRAVAAVSGFFDIDHLAEPYLVRRFIVQPAFGRRGPGWRDASPLTHAGVHWPPTLLVSAAADRSAGPQSNALCSRLRNAGVRCSRIVVPASRDATAIARLGEGRAAPEFEAITEFLVDTTRAGPRTGASAAGPMGAAPEEPEPLRGRGHGRRRLLRPDARAGDRPHCSLAAPWLAAERSRLEIEQDATRRDCLPHRYRSHRANGKGYRRRCR